MQTNDGDLFNFFNTRKPPGQGGSADFQCFKDGRLQQFVDLVDQSWAQGSTQHNGNPYFVSCEFEGATSEPMTAAQIDQGGRLIAWAWANVGPFPLVYNLDPDGSGITPHHVFGGGHTCPGPGPREGQFPDLIAAANRWLTGSSPMEDAMSASYTDAFTHFHAFGAKGNTVYETVWTGAQYEGPATVGDFDRPHGLALSVTGARVDLTLIDGAGVMHHGVRNAEGQAWVWDVIPGTYD